eukprot:GILK01000486.1.p2 GENE.GILK01000486.1~~GILK01000486.1.p2  ORF type:complete len:462 (-),score=103.41 GILK01000486.1:1980-3320(-)
MADTDAPTQDVPMVDAPAAMDDELKQTEESSQSVQAETGSTETTSESPKEEASKPAPSPRKRGRPATAQSPKVEKEDAAKDEEKTTAAAPKESKEKAVEASPKKRGRAATKKEEKPRVEGTRSTSRTIKTVTRFEPVSNEAKEIEIVQGEGEKLGDIPNVAFNLNNEKRNSEILKVLHRLCFGNRAANNKYRENLFEFSGFAWKDKDRDAEVERLEQRIFHIKVAFLKELLAALDLEKSGDKEQQAARLIEFLEKPKASGKSNLTAKAEKKEAKNKRSKAKSAEKKTAAKKKTPKKGKKSEAEEEDDEEEEETEEEEEEEEGDDDFKPGQKGGKGARRGSGKRKSRAKGDDEEEDESAEEEQKPKRARKQAKKAEEEEEEEEEARNEQNKTLEGASVQRFYIMNFLTAILIGLTRHRHTHTDTHTHTHTVSTWSTTREHTARCRKS